MKKTLSILIAVIAAFYSQAQSDSGAGLQADSRVSSQSATSKGSMFAGGSIHYSQSSGKTEDVIAYKYLRFGVNPNFGYFITDKFALGISAEFSINKGLYDTLTSDYQSVQRIYGTGPFARYYGSIVGNFGYFINGALNYRFTNSEMNGEPEYKINTFSISAAPGLYYFITPKFCLEAGIAGISYDLESRKSELTDIEIRHDTFNFSGTFSSVFLGMNIFF